MDAWLTHVDPCFHITFFCVLGYGLNISIFGADIPSGPFASVQGVSADQADLEVDAPGVVRRWDQQVILESDVAAVGGGGDGFDVH